MGILFWDHVRKHKSDDNKYLEYRKNTKIFYTDESLEYLKKGKIAYRNKIRRQKTRQCIQCNSRYFGIYNISSDTCINSYQNFLFFYCCNSDVYIISIRNI